MFEDNKFLNWQVLGRGNERCCYLNPNVQSLCIKVSNKNNAKQSKREIRYFNLLKKRHVPFIFIPDFYRVVETDGYLGVEQEVILNSDGTLCENVEGYIEKHCHNKDDELEFLAVMDMLKCYLLKYNIIPCDLMLSNILIKSNDNLEAYLIDGFGSTQLIPLHDYISFLGRKKIKRKWSIFIKERVKPLLKYS